LARDREEARELPEWLLADERYEPAADRDSFIRKSMEAVAGVLARLRLDGGRPWALSPSAPVKLVLGLLAIILGSCATNFAFTLLLLAVTLVRMALLPQKALSRCLKTSAGAAILSALLMLPAILLGQASSALLIGTKVFVSVSIAMIVALSTPLSELAGALRAFHVPNVFILTVELALKSIYDLGQTALEVLGSLKMRSVGRNHEKGSALGGVGGVVLLKAQRAAKTTSDAMRCRGFEGDYIVPDTLAFRPADALWAAGAILLVAAFLVLEGVF
jgi:cobalt/nickel transport system permease protein